MSLCRKPSTVGFLVLMAFAVTVVSPMTALADKRGRQNTAVGLTAAAIAAAATHHKTAAIVLGGGAAYAWKRHADARTSEARQRGYSRGYHRGYSRGYHRGYARGHRRYSSHRLHTVRR